MRKKKEKSEYKWNTRICTIFVLLSRFVAIISAYTKDIPGVVTNIIAFAIRSYLLYFIYPPKD